MVHVQPEAEPLAHLLPVLDVTEDGLAAQSVEPRPAVGRRRPLIEHEGPVLGPAVHRFLESVRPLPEIKDLLLEPRQIYLRADLIELHGADLLTKMLPPQGGASLHRRDGSLHEALAVPPYLSGTSRVRSSQWRRGLPKRTRCNGLARPVLLTV